MNNSDSLSGKTALVTGAGRGIGEAIARILGGRGARLILLDKDEGNVSTVVQALTSAGINSEALVADIAHTKKFDSVLGERAGHVDVLVNCAGISGQEAPFLKIDEVAYDRMMDIHVKGAFYLTQKVVPGMMERKFGRIINISSNRGMVGYKRSSHYCAAKAALLGLTKAWAKELAPHNILVNAVAPGVVLTEMNTWNGMEPLYEEASWNLLNRWAEPDEIAFLVAFLVSPEGSFFTGQVISPNGGDPIVGI